MRLLDHTLFRLRSVLCMLKLPVLTTPGWPQIVARDDVLQARTRSCRADFLVRVGQADAAAQSYRRAIDFSPLEA
jgi:hypothetical protein